MTGRYVKIDTVDKFKLRSRYKPTFDQKRAIKEIVKGRISGQENQVLLGVTGSGKTFTVANVIEKLQKPALIISHNKTLAAQLYQEFRDYFPENAVSYFVSYYDYYQPEAYIPSTDTYIEKDSAINELIDKLRLATTANLLTQTDTIVIASVSCIYNIGNPSEYEKFFFKLRTKMKISREQIIDKFIDLQYERSDFGFHRGTFRVRGNSIDIFLAYKDVGLRIELDEKTITKIVEIDPISGDESIKNKSLSKYVIYPAKHFITSSEGNEKNIKKIRSDLKEQVEMFKKNGKVLEAHRLKQKVEYDLEMIEEMGYVKGIENYSRYFDSRKPGEAPYSLLDYFTKKRGDDWLVVVDESHITFPQIRGMYAGDRSRKQTLIKYGFRLPSALDNRPLTFDEFMKKIPGFLATSATPADWELSMARQSAENDSKSIAHSTTIEKTPNVIEQLLRPTGIPDPKVEIRSVSTQVADVICEIKKRAKFGNKSDRGIKQRSLVTTLTKRTAEDLAYHLETQGIKAQYLHSDIKTLERSDILDDLRLGKYDCLIGVNLLREGLDLPEVSFVAILDADKEGFLRSEVSLIQTMGRAARHVDGKVILYADKITGSMERALNEVGRRRKYQIALNTKMGIVPRSINKPIREKLVSEDEENEIDNLFGKKQKRTLLEEIDIDSLTPLDKKMLVKKLREEMRIAAQDLNFELAIDIRDKIRQVEK